MTYPYGPSPYGAGAARPHPRGALILVLGIIGLVGCLPSAIIALVLGNIAMKEIDANPGGYSNRGLVKAGQIMGIIGIVIAVLGFIIRLAAAAHGG